MIRDIEELLGQYRTWLQQKTALRNLGEWVEITTPFLDRHNDCIQLFARRGDGGWLLSDDGYTIADLETSGLDVRSGKRREILENTLRGFGVSLGEDNDLTVTASDAQFPFKKHNLIQAMIGVGDLFYLSRSRVVSAFFEDVQEWMDVSDIRYTPNVRLAGRSGYEHRFEFVIPHSKQRPERLIRLLNIAEKNTAESAIFSLSDVRELRNNAVGYAIINDRREVGEGVLEALNAYSITPVLWSKREESKEALAA